MEPEGHCHGHKSSPLVNILSQMIPVHTTPSYNFLSSILIFSHARLGFLSDFVLSGIPTKKPCMQSPSLPCVPHVHPISFYLTLSFELYLARNEYYEVLSNLPLFHHSSVQTFSFQHFVLKHPQSMLLP
jgi:hypothetical protein